MVDLINAINIEDGNLDIWLLILKEIDLIWLISYMFKLYKWYGL